MSYDKRANATKFVKRDLCISACAKRVMKQLAVYNVILKSTPGPRTKESPEFPGLCATFPMEPLL